MYKTVFPPKNITPDAIEFLNKIIDKIVNDIYITKYDKESRYWKEWAPFLYILTRHYYNNQSAKDIFDFVENLLEDDMYIQLQKLDPSDIHASLACIMGDSFDLQRSSTYPLSEENYENFPSVFMAQKSTSTSKAKKSTSITASAKISPEEQIPEIYTNLIKNALHPTVSRIVPPEIIINWRLEPSQAAIHFFGGIKEIGGNKLLIQNKANHSILLDFGYSFDTIKKYSLGLQTPIRTVVSIPDEISIGMLPPPKNNLAGIYREDILDRQKAKIFEFFSTNPEIKAAFDAYPFLISEEQVDSSGKAHTLFYLYNINQKYIQSIQVRDSTISINKDLQKIQIAKDGQITASDQEYPEQVVNPRIDKIFTPPTNITHVLISHAHSDHIGSIRYLNHNIDLVMGAKVFSLINFFQQYSRWAPWTDLLQFKNKMENRQYNSLYRHTLVMDSQPEQLSDFKIQFIESDHSSIGAGGYIIETEGKKIVYSGDLRDHGNNPTRFKEFTKKITDTKPDIILMEFTRWDIKDNGLKNAFGEEYQKIKKNGQPSPQMVSYLTKILQQYEKPQLSEEKILDDITLIMKKHSSQIFWVESANYDIERLNNIKRAASATNRIFVVSPRTYLLLSMGLNLLESPNAALIEDIRILVPKKTDRGNELDPYLRSLSPSDLERCITPEEINRTPNAFVVQFNLFMAMELTDIAVKNGFYLEMRSIWHDPEEEALQEKKWNWLSLWGITKDSDHYNNTHTSGHICPISAVEFLNTIASVVNKTLVVIPIHSQNPEVIDALSICRSHLPPEYNSYLLHKSIAIQLPDKHGSIPI